MKAYDFSEIKEETIRVIAKKFDLEVWEAKVKIQITAEIYNLSLERAVEYLLNPNIRW